MFWMMRSRSSLFAVMGIRFLSAIRATKNRVPHQETRFTLRGVFDSSGYLPLAHRLGHSASANPPCELLRRLAESDLPTLPDAGTIIHESAVNSIPIPSTDFVFRGAGRVDLGHGEW